MGNVSVTSTLTENQIAQTFIEGNLAIRDSEVLKEALLSLLEKHINIEIYFKNINCVDISILQLLVAMHKSASAEQKSIKYFFEDSEYFNNILNHSGYYNFFSAHN